MYLSQERIFRNLDEQALDNYLGWKSLFLPRNTEGCPGFKGESESILELEKDEYVGLAPGKNKNGCWVKYSFPVIRKGDLEVLVWAMK